MAEAYRFEIAHEDLIFELRPDHTLCNFMEVVCDEWLNESRGGDGGAYDHLWDVRVGGKKFTGPHSDYEHMTPQLTRLRDLSFTPGCTLDVTYDMGSTTYFTVRFVSIEQVSSDVELPRRVHQSSSLASYVPPEGTPNLNVVFPYANDLLFGEKSVAQWLLPFPCAKDCAGAVEAGPNAMSDVVFMPHKFSSLKELLVAFNEAGKQNPDPSIRSDAFARMTFPRSMAAKDEEKYNMFKEDLDEFERYCTDHGLGANVPLFAMGGHPESVMYRLCGPKEVVIRVSDENMASVEAVAVEAAFPKCSKAYLDKHHLWISYRRGKMMICKGFGSSDRGIPKPGSVVASASQLNICSLHDFFCAAEALFSGLV